MSLNQKYTWHDFLKEHPEFKEKGIKRMSAEGKKAFESAYKDFIKKHLSERAKKIEREMECAKKRREEIMAKVKELRKARKHPRAGFCQEKAGRQDAWGGRLTRQKDRTTTLQKSFK